MPAVPATGVPVRSLFAVAGCDFGTTAVLSHSKSTTDTDLLPSGLIRSPQLTSGSAVCEVPAVEHQGERARLLWLDDQNDPAVVDVLEAAGFFRAAQTVYPQFSWDPQLELQDGAQTFSLERALILWDSWAAYWSSAQTNEADWFGQDTLRRCGRCPVCREQMRAHDDAGLLERVGAKNRAVLQAELGVRTIGDLARLPQERVLPRWAEAVGEAALRVGVERPEVYLLTAQEDSWDEERSARDIELLAAERTQQLLSEEDLPLEVEPLTDAEIRLTTYVESLPEGELSAKDQAIAMIASATGYHRRERTEFWTAHFERVYRHMGSWELGRGVGLVKDAQPIEDWAPDPERSRAQPTRVFEVFVQTGESFSLKPGDKGLCLYYGEDYPAHLATRRGDLALRYEDRNGKLPSVINVPDFRAEIIEVDASADLVRVRIRESLPKKTDEFHQLPLAIGPASPIPTRAQEAALAQLAQETGETLPELPSNAAADLAVRRPPRLTSGQLANPADFSGESPLAEALIDTLPRLDSSYVAVQGPPGAGKTFVGSKVLGALITQGWKIGVVAQSHAVVENMLAGCITKGKVDPERVRKFKGKTQSKTPLWGEIDPKELPDYLEDGAGFLIGGTAWDFSAEKKFPAGCLDLLVIDEAGQYSLANTFAVARAARNLLLLGDPQQLPQVTQGVHPHHVEESALGWLIGDAPVLPTDLGYFMDQTWRMHPALCAPVSKLAYEGVLKSASAASARFLKGWEPGVYVERTRHDFNTTASAEEAETIAATAARFIGSEWTQDGTTRSLTPADILVVAAYNAQVDTVSAALEKAGLAGVKVGTVDKFQGQEAPVVLVSMAASSPATSEQAAEFLLSPNRLNVAISRGQWCAVLICSPQFTRYVPRSLPELKLLSSFVTLVEEAEDLA